MDPTAITFLKNLEMWELPKFLLGIPQNTEILRNFYLVYRSDSLKESGKFPKFFKKFGNFPKLPEFP